MPRVMLQTLTAGMGLDGTANSRVFPDNTQAPGFLHAPSNLCRSPVTPEPDRV